MRVRCLPRCALGVEGRLDRTQLGACLTQRVDAHELQRRVVEHEDLRVLRVSRPQPHMRAHPAVGRERVGHLVRVRVRAWARARVRVRVRTRVRARARVRFRARVRVRAGVRVRVRARVRVRVGRARARREPPARSGRRTASLVRVRARVRVGVGVRVRVGAWVGLARLISLTLCRRQRRLAAVNTP